MFQEGKEEYKFEWQKGAPREKYGLLLQFYYAIFEKNYCWKTKIYTHVQSVMASKR